MNKYERFEKEIQVLKDNSLYKKNYILESSNDAYIKIEGKSVLNLASNNYLGFANDPDLKEAAKLAIDQYGVGSGAVRVIAGHLKIHQQLEDALAKFKKEEAVLVFQSGFNVNAGVIQAITNENDLILSDEFNHASIIDGMRLSKAKRIIYKHSDMLELENILKEERSKYDQVLIITDGVFSMDGDLAKLPKIVELAQKYDALTYVDDAHGSGVMGTLGKGTVDHFKLNGQVDFIVGTLSKAFGVIGGYVACKNTLKEYLIQRARPLLFSTSLSPADTAAILAAIKKLESGADLVEKLWMNGNSLKAKLVEIGLDIGHSETPITPLMIGDETLTLAFAKRLLEEGIYVSPIIFPTVPKGKARLRLMVSSSHKFKDIEFAVSKIKMIAQELKLI